jgi:hypothetical protein
MARKSNVTRLEAYFCEVDVTNGVSVSNGALDTMTSRCVIARLGLNGVQSGHKDVYWFGPNVPTSSECCFSCYSAPGACSRGYKYFKRGRSSEVSGV